ncbi:MAG: hypothetical protein ACRDY7_05830 [Acidimicrobiia bacterium]
MIPPTRKGSLRSLLFAIPGLALVVFSGSGAARLMGGVSTLVFAFFAYVNYYGARPDRELPARIVEVLDDMERVRPNEHKVTLILDDGSVVPGVTITYGRFVELPLGRARLRFDPKQVVAVRPDR